jgi:DNA ligase (NAD+)
MKRELGRQYPELKFVRPEKEAVYRVFGATGPLILKKSLEHFASKGALDIDGMGEKNVSAIVEAGFVKDLADIYTISLDQVEQLDRFATISATKLVSAIAKVKHPPLGRFIYGLGIRHVGTQTAIDLAEHFGSLEALAESGLDELMDIDGVGDIVAESIVGWFADPDNQNLITKFKDLGVEPIFESHATGPLKGEKFVITGTLSKVGRSEAADKIRSLGGIFQTSVAKDTTYLVVGADAGASKIKKAQQLGTKTINENELVELISKA